MDTMEGHVTAKKGSMNHKKKIPQTLALRIYASLAAEEFKINFS
jgi:hypothetical protein